MAAASTTSCLFAGLLPRGRTPTPLAPSPEVRLPGQGQATRVLPPSGSDTRDETPDSGSLAAPPVHTDAQTHLRTHTAHTDHTRTAGVAAPSHV